MPPSSRVLPPWSPAQHEGWFGGGKGGGISHLGIWMIVAAVYQPQPQEGSDHLLDDGWMNGWRRGEPHP